MKSTNPIQTIRSIYPANKYLYEIPTEDFATGTPFAEAIRLIGATESALGFISRNWWWSLTVAEFCAEIISHVEDAAMLIQ